MDLRDQTNIGTVSPGQDKPLRLLLKRAEEKKNAIPAEDVANALARGLPPRKEAFDQYSAKLKLDANRARATYLEEKNMTRLSLDVRQIMLEELHADFDIDRTGYITEEEIFDIAMARRKSGHASSEWTTEKNRSAPCTRPVPLTPCLLPSRKFAMKLGGEDGKIWPEEFAEGMANVVTDEEVGFLKFMEGCRVVSKKLQAEWAVTFFPAIPSALAHSPLPRQNKLSRRKNGRSRSPPEPMG